ncbi:hypothetical protein F7018_11225 [Tenacibaculum aiptasiae]|uniref:Uncharacterized protein n=1 Tax=Tenacibaculum aiptasiae TaxID=426481 RepID=A0A7J5AER8_9FLAO|nr:hypothetical protein [Tenacibaculum aiptasiae]KAB1155983.1 hypothetical protein F7018_11225 [Tenacibaculum aiptasiae]
MKFLKLLFFVLLICISCNVNNEEIQIIEKEQNKANRNNFNSKPFQIYNAQEVEQLMFMTSFLIGKTLIENESARDFFYNHIADSRITAIKLSDIMDDDTMDSNPFEIEFQKQFNKYNYHKNPQTGETDPPTSTSLDPDPFRWGGIFGPTMLYELFIDKVINLNDWELYFPNKNSVLSNGLTLTEYFQRNDRVICLWRLNEKIKRIYSDGLILYTDGRGSYLPLNFNPSNSSSFTFLLRN